MYELKIILIAIAMLAAAVAFLLLPERIADWLGKRSKRRQMRGKRL